MRQPWRRASFPPPLPRHGGWRDFFVTLHAVLCRIGKVNNHVSKTEKNVVSLSHEEVLAVKQAFVKALREGGVSADF